MDEVHATAARRAGIPARQRPGARARMPSSRAPHLPRTLVARHRLARVSEPPPRRRRIVPFRPRLRGGDSSQLPIHVALFCLFPAQQTNKGRLLVQFIPSFRTSHPHCRLRPQTSGAQEKSGTKSGRLDHVYGSPSRLSTSTVARANKSLAAKKGPNEDKLFHYTPLARASPDLRAGLWSYESIL